MRITLIVLAFLITSFSFAQGGGKIDAIKFRGKVTDTQRDSFDVPNGETWIIYNETSSALEISNDNDVWRLISNEQMSQANFDSYTTTQRDALDVPSGEIWMIYNNTTNLFEYAESNDVWQTVGSGIQEGANSIASGIELNQGITNGIEILPDLNGNPSIRIKAGNQDDSVFFVMSDDNVNWSFASSSETYKINPLGETDPDDIARKSYVDAQSSVGASLESANQTIGVDVGRNITVTAGGSNQSSLNLVNGSGAQMSLNNNGITFLESPIIPTPTSSFQPATKVYVDQQDELQDEAAEVFVTASPSNYSAGDGSVEDHLSGIDSELGSIGTQTLAEVLIEGNSAGNSRITNLADGTQPQDAVTKSQLDGLSAGTDALVDETETTTTYTPTDADNYKLKYIKNVDDITLSTPTGTFADGDNISFVQDSTGVVEFDYKDIRKDVYYRTTASGAIVTTHYTGSGWAFLCGQCETYTPVAPVTNLYTPSDALNDENEANSIPANITDSGNVSLSVVASDGTGNFVLRVEHTGTVNQSADVYIDLVGLVDATEYDVTVGWKSISGSDNWNLLLDDNNGWVTQQQVGKITTSYAELTMTSITNQNTPELRISGTSSADVGDVFYVYLIRVE